MDCLFCKIASGEIPAKIQHQDEKVVVFADIHPQAPVHLLIIPRHHIATLNDLTAQNSDIIGYMAQTAAKLATEMNIHENGYRCVMNCNADGGQTVFHIHMHLLAGRTLTWPPG